MRIAAVSSDGKFINQHFGHAQQFYIFERLEDRFQFLELRRGKAFCNGGDHNNKELKDAIDIIDDCSYILAVQAGYGAVEALNERGICVKIAIGFIDDCLKEFFKELTEGNR
ncbi:NifB/NifX family molybdenum-iron cluster-binding protein [Acetobacterium tundrae]|uniref:Dinitrogenase iron-molybdenum cofactor biosynthesis protein n=1 Tax=Acetobacterium tundrae TaxID=132932 RepID=A0ABR6WJ45_9FIRM|nr:NifB/NifX family molybdenum-iron cluster-binding protein [Acetobacterium tundrae]MBC3796471.1 dinitrogenase iron-molybdenum cofactor biosynthesis protein [Acetobacterium tundrae]